MKTEKEKSENICSLSSDIRCLDRDLEESKKILTFPSAVIQIKGNSDSIVIERVNIDIGKQLKKPLYEFLENYYNQEKQKIYEEMKKVLSDEC